MELLNEVKEYWVILVIGIVVLVVVFGRNRKSVEVSLNDQNNVTLCENEGTNNAVSEGFKNKIQDICPDKAAKLIEIITAPRTEVGVPKKID